MTDISAAGASCGGRSERDPVAYVPGAAALYLVDHREAPLIHLLSDDGPARRTLDSVVSANSPPYSAAAIDSREPGAVFAGDAQPYELSDNASGAAAFWGFAHQGNGCTIVMRVQQAAGVVDGQILARTKTQSASQAGIIVWYTGATQSYRLQVYNASTSILNVGSGSIAPGPHTLVWTFGPGSPSGILRVDGAQTATADFTGVPAAGSAGRGLVLGKTFVEGGWHNFDGAIKLFAIYPRVLTAREVVQWEQAAEVQRSVRTRRVIRCLGDSITEHTNSYRTKLWERICRSRDQRAEMVGKFTGGNYPLGDTRHDGVSGQSIEAITGRVPAYGGQEVTDLIVMSGTNNAGQSVPTMLAAKALEIEAVRAKHPAARLWLLPIAIGPSANATKFAEFNVGLRQLASLNSAVATYVDFYLQPYGFIAQDAGDSLDASGHPTVQGGNKVGNALADALGFGSDFT